MAQDSWKISLRTEGLFENIYLKFISGCLLNAFLCWEGVWAGAAGASRQGDVVLDACTRWGVPRLHRACLTAGGKGGEMVRSVQKWFGLSLWWHGLEGKPVLRPFPKACWSPPAFSLHCFPRASSHKEQGPAPSSGSEHSQSWQRSSPAAAMGRTATERQQVPLNILAPLSVWCGRPFSPCCQALWKSLLAKLLFAPLWDKLDSSVGWKCFCLEQKWFSSWLGCC